jgi:hypothetical protein
MHIIGRLFAAVFIALALSASPAYAAVKLKAVIDKSEQRMYVYDGKGTLLHNWCASTGKVSSYSRVGTFRPHRFWPGTHYSSSYGGKMIDSVYYDGNRAVHGVDDPAELEALCKYGTSYGCTHLSAEHANIFYNLVVNLKRSEVQIIVQE